MSLSDDNDINIEAKIYDTGGVRRFRASNISLINKADCILLVLDASNNYQKEGIIFYYEEILKRKARSTHLIFVSNKIKFEDKYINWPKEDRIKFINNLRKFNEAHIEIDCKEGYNIDNLKVLIIMCYLNKIRKVKTIINFENSMCYLNKIKKIIKLEKPKRKKIKNKCT